MSQQLPDPSFQVLVSTFATQAAVGLGQIANPVTNEVALDLVQAKFAIDMLQVIEEKSAGNRTSDEDAYLADVLYQLRMVYIDKNK